MQNRVQSPLALKMELHRNENWWATFKTHLYILCSSPTSSLYPFSRGIGEQSLLKHCDLLVNFSHFGRKRLSSSFGWHWKKLKWDVLHQAFSTPSLLAYRAFMAILTVSVREGVFLLWYYTPCFLLIFKINFSKYHFINHWLYRLGLPQGSHKSFPVWSKDFCLKMKCGFGFLGKKIKILRPLSATSLLQAISLYPHRVQFY